MSGRAEETGSTTYLHARNKDLECQVRSQDREISRLKDDLEASERKVRELNQEIRGFRARIESSGSSLGPGGSPSGMGADVGAVLRPKKSKPSMDVEEITKSILKTVNDGLDE